MSCDRRFGLLLTKTRSPRIYSLLYDLGYLKHLIENGAVKAIEEQVKQEINMHIDSLVDAEIKRHVEEGSKLQTKAEKQRAEISQAVVGLHNS